jgi:hypothetical protein
MDYIDLWDQFLGADGKPREDLFLQDRLHNNGDGYKIRADVVRPHLKPPAPQCRSGVGNQPQDGSLRRPAVVHP